MASADQGLCIQIPQFSPSITPAGGIQGAVSSSFGSYGFPLTVADVSVPDRGKTLVLGALTLGLPKPTNRLYKLRGKDTGNGFVFWVSSDPNSNYPGSLIGTLVDKQIAAIIPVG